MTTPHQWRLAITEGLHKGIRGTLWMLKILVPCSLLTFLIDTSGLLGQMDYVLAPAMGLLGLPSEAALPLGVGLLAGIYGAVAALAVLDLGMTATTLVAVFLLISHSLIQEGIVQARSGLPFFKATLVRLAASVACVVGLSRLLPKDMGLDPSIASLAPAAEPFGARFQDWLGDTGILCVQILVIITAMMIVLELLRAARIIPRLARILRPILWLMGLPPGVGMLWLTAAVFGLSYGAAVIVEETRNGAFAKEDIKRLQLSIGINHALIEDPAIFLALGIPAIWLWGPRLVAALLAVHLYRLWHFGRRRRRSHGTKRTVTDPAGSGG
jgi:spore maturation protein SpmB